MHQHLAVAAAILKIRKCAILLRPFLSSKSFKNVSNYKHSWSVQFLPWSLSIHFSSKTTVIISILGEHNFWLDRLILRIFIFPKEILKFWRPHEIVFFYNFRFVVFLKEILQFRRPHGIVIFDHISLLSHVFANIQNFDA